MNPYQRQKMVIWGIYAGALACGLATWLLFPGASLLMGYLGIGAIITLWCYVRRVSTQWPDVAHAQMRELAQRRAASESDCEGARGADQCVPRYKGRRNLH